MYHRSALLSAVMLLAACGASTPPANTVNAVETAGPAAPANAAGPAPAAIATATTGIETPPAAELQAAMNSISDPQLAAQVAPDGDYDAAECVVHIGQFEPVPAAQEAALTRATAAWRARVVRELGETGAAQMIGSSVNPLQPTPPALRRAAVVWCLANAPRNQG